MGQHAQGNLRLFFFLALLVCYIPLFAIVALLYSLVFLVLVLYYILFLVLFAC